MKIIDHTPFYNEKGEISLVDRGKAMMKFGSGWFKEIEAQKVVVAVLDKAIDRSYTLLRNFTPPGMDTSFPFILIGPSGVFSMYVTPLVGTFRAKGDQWGTITGNAFKPEKPNLLVRTERMARAVQVYLQRQGFTDLLLVEPVLLCPDPGINVDSQRPIVRVVMRDALERFAISVTQARMMLNPETVHNIINRLTIQPKPAEAQPEESAAVAPAVAAPAVKNEPSAVQAEENHVPAFALPESEVPNWTAEQIGHDFKEVKFPQAADETSMEDLFGLPQTGPAPLPDTQVRRRVRRRSALNRRQWGLLIAIFVIWCLITAVFVFLVVKDLYL